jgi:anti-sigma factor RsiW
MADNGLNPMQRAALEAHWAECPACRRDALEINRLDRILAWALRAHWGTPRRSSSEVARQVRRRLNFDSSLKFCSAMAQAAVKLGTGLVVLILAINLAQGSGLRPAEPLPLNAITNHDHIPGFELSAESELLPLAAVELNNSDEANVPYILPSGFRVY